MPESRYVSAERLKPLIAYLACAFVVILAVGAFVPRGGLRAALVVAWIVLFPAAGWWVYRRGER